LVTRRLASRVVVSVGLTLDRDVIAVEGEVGGLAEPVRARRLTDQEGRKLQQIVRRGRHESVRVRRALIIMASASGTTVPAIARLVAAHEDTVRDVIHAFNERGLAALDPQWAGGRPRLISSDDEEFIVTAATTRPVKLGRPFTHWSIRKLADYLADNPVRVVKVGRERLRQILRAHGISFQRTRTWKESKDPDKDVKLDRIEEVTSRFPDRCFAFDQFGPLSIRPCHGTCWARRTRPDRLPATYHRTHGIPVLPRLLLPGRRPTVGRDPPPQRRRPHPRGPEVDPGRPPDGAPIYVILDNLSANKTPAIRAWAARHKVRLCFTPTSASWANPIEAQFGPLRTFVMGNSDHPHHAALTRRLQAYLRWRDANARHPDVLAAQRRERARIRSQRQQRWGRPKPKAA
jgi:transposase